MVLQSEMFYPILTSEFVRLFPKVYSVCACVSVSFQLVPINCVYKSLCVFAFKSLPYSSVLHGRR